MSTTETKKPNVSDSEAAIMIGVSAPTVRRLRAAGELAYFKAGPHPTSPIRIPRCSVEAFIIRNQGGAL